jgi:transcriptional regulator with XRE-family HTH domain
LHWKLQSIKFGRDCGGSSLTPRQRFSANLRKARRASGVSQQELGDRCDLHRTEISLLERGGREPRLGTIVKLASALGVTPESLCVGMRWDVKAQSYRYKG